MKRLVLFDYDGTLVNSMGHVYKRVCNVFRRAGVTPPIFEDYVLRFYFPFDKYYQSLGVRADANQILEWYNEGEKDPDPDFFVDAKQTVAGLLERDYILIIVTAGREQRVRQNLSRKNMAHLFEVYSTQNKTEVIRELAKRSSLGARTWYVGDIPHDMREAKEAGVTPAAILRNGMMQHSRRFQDAGATRCISSLTNLLTALP